jgi:hypothetical protein
MSLISAGSISLDSAFKFLSTGEIMEEPVPCGGNYMCPNGTICKERSLYI